MSHSETPFLAQRLLYFLVAEEEFMKWFYKALWFSAVMVVSASTLVACGKKDKNSSNVAISGNISSDGNGIVSTSVINGMQTQVQLTRIQRNMTNTGYNPGYSQTSGPIQIEVMINNMMGPMITVYPSSYSSTSRQSTVVGNVRMTYEALCADYVCDNVVINTYYEFSGSQEVKQIGVLKMMSQNRVRAAHERLLSQGALMSADQMKNQLLQQAGNN
jgi:hypothetical protein